MPCAVALRELARFFHRRCGLGKATFCRPLATDPRRRSDRCQCTSGRRGRTAMTNPSGSAPYRSAVTPRPEQRANDRSHDPGAAESPLRSPQTRRQCHRATCWNAGLEQIHLADQPPARDPPPLPAERLSAGLKLTVNARKPRCLRCPEEPMEFLGRRTRSAPGCATPLTTTTAGRRPCSASQPPPGSSRRAMASSDDAEPRPRGKPTLHAVPLPPTAGRELVPRVTTCPSFRQNRGPMRRRHAQTGGIPRFIVLCAGTGAGACHRAESGCVQPPDPG